MVLCQFFLSGNCRFGTKCFNEHIDLKQIIRVEIDSAIKGNQWPISCFGPFKDKPCIPNFIEDQSFEEIRYQFYEAKINGNFEQVRQSFIILIQDSKVKLQQLNMLSPDIMNIFVQLYNAGAEQKKTNPVVGQSNAIAANPFASTNIGNAQGGNQAQNIFGKSTLTTTDQSPANIFGGGASNQQQTSIIFGSGSFTAPNQSPGVFGGGQTQQQPQQSIFGSPVQSTPSVFGQTNPFQGTNTSSQFALPQLGTQQPTQNVFGSPQQTQSVFSTQNQTQPTTNIFSAQNTFQQPNQPIQSVFAAPPNQSQFGGGQQSIFTQQQQPQQQTANVFQNQQPQPSVFGQPSQPDNNATQMRDNVFNQAQQQQSVFGQAQSNQSPFQQPLPVTQQSAQSSQFAPQQPVQPQVQQQPVQLPVQQLPVQQPAQNQQSTKGYYDTIYSKMSDLTQEELEAFKSDQFEIGKIPTVPPPKDLCF